MEGRLPAYQRLLGRDSLRSLFELSDSLKRIKIVHVNSTKEGGGVAEILTQMVPLCRQLGMQVEWETIKGSQRFFRCTKMFHNLLQGEKIAEPDSCILKEYEKINRENAKSMKELLETADAVFVHDPQPLALIDHFPKRKGKWVWRCHIDLSSPSEETWGYLKKFVERYDASVFSMREFARTLAKPVYIIPPSIDPFSEKNKDLPLEEIKSVYLLFNIDLKRPILLQVSRFDRFKDPIGVIEAYRLAKKTHPDLQLVLAGGGAADDPEGDAVLREVKKAAAGDPDLFILLLPPTSHRVINALQRGASIVIQKSLKEGFGLTVSEALWKAKPVIGGDCGGIRLQIIDGKTGYLVDSSQKAGQRICELLENSQLAERFGSAGRDIVKDRFLITRNIKDDLTVIRSLKV